MDELLEQIKRHEGLRLKPYRCPSGKLSIGYGRNLEDSGISLEEAELMLRNDISSLRNVLRHYSWWESLDDVRKDAIVNMAYNLGVIGLLKFKRMIFALKKNDYDTAAIEMMNSKWAEQVGDRAKELSNQIRTGNYEGLVQIKDNMG